MLFRDIVTLTKSTVTKDVLGHAYFGAAAEVGTVYASVRMMSASKTMMTFQLADAVGLEIEMWKPSVEFNGLLWSGHDVHFSEAVNVDEAGKRIRISGYYQHDNPVQSNG